MAMFYSDTGPRENVQIDVWKMDGTKAYLRHYANLLTLKFMAKTTPDRKERADLEKEIAICERKLKFWERHPNTFAEGVREGMELLNKQWQQPAA